MPDIDADKKQKASLLSIAQAVVNTVGHCVFHEDKFWWYSEKTWRDETVNVRNAVVVACNGRDVDKVLTLVQYKFALPASVDTPYYKWVDAGAGWSQSGWEALAIKDEEVIFSNGVLNLLTGERRTSTGEIWGPVINLNMEDLPDLGSGGVWPAKFTALLETIKTGLEADEETMVCFQDCFSFLLRPHVHFRHAMYITGPAGSRKSTVATALALAPCGSGGVSRVSERRLGYDDRFASSGLVGKIANLSDDTPGDQRYRDWFKSYTGNGIFQAEYKFVNPRNYMATAKLISTCNQLPQMTDSSDALASRLLIFDFVKQGDSAEPELVSNGPWLSGAYWSDPSVRLHIVAWLLAGARRVVAAGETFRKSKRMIASITEYIENSDPIRTWVEAHLQATGKAEDFIPTETLYRLMDTVGSLCTPKELACYIERLGGKLERRQKDGMRLRGFSGVVVKSGQQESASGHPQVVTGEVSAG